MSNDEQVMDELRAQIADTARQREALKQSLEQGAVPVAQGLRELERIDSQLSALDSRFKALWDSTNPGVQ